MNVDKKTIAGLLGVTETHVINLRVKGMPFEGRGHAKTYPVLECMQFYFGEREGSRRYQEFLNRELDKTQEG